MMDIGSQMLHCVEKGIDQEVVAVAIKLHGEIWHPNLVPDRDLMGGGEILHLEEETQPHIVQGENRQRIDRGSDLADARKHTEPNMTDIVLPIDLIVESLRGTQAPIGVTVHVPNKRMLAQAA